MAKLEKDALDANRKAVLDAFLLSDKTYASSGFAGRLMNAGYSGIISKIDMVDIDGVNVTPRLNDQIVDGKQVANEGAASALVSLVFDDGRTIAIAAMTSHPETTINGALTTKLGGKDWAALVGKTFTCDERFADEAKASTRTLTGQAPRRSVPQRYKITVA